MIEDKELDKLEIIKQEQANNIVASKPVIETQFSKQMDEVKQNVLTDAASTDNTFVDTIKKNVKEAAVTLTEVEKDKAKYQQQEVQYESEKLETKQKKNIQEQNADAWDDKKKRRQFHFDGVKPIMNFVGITEPMNLGFLYFLSVVLTPLFLVAKFVKGSFGALISGASDDNRGKAARGFLWTVTCIFAVLVVVCLVYLFLKWQGIDILANIKN